MRKRKGSKIQRVQSFDQRNLESWAKRVVERLGVNKNAGAREIIRARA
jgi:hypothetical protein